VRDVRAAPRDPRSRTISGLVQLVTQAPWTLSGEDRSRAHAAGLDDATILHVIMLSSFFGYLNRIADAVGIELDYEVAVRPPAADPSTPPWPRADIVIDTLAPRALRLEQRPGAMEAMEPWFARVLDRDEPLTRAQRRRVLDVAIATVGDGRAHRVEVASTALEHELDELTETIALAPWRLGADALRGVREAGLTGDEAVFDAIQVAAFCNFEARMTVALAAISRE